RQVAGTGRAFPASRSPVRAAPGHLPCAYRAGGLPRVGGGCRLEPRRVRGVVVRSTETSVADVTAVGERERNRGGHEERRGQRSAVPWCAKCCIARQRASASMVRW